MLRQQEWENAFSWFCVPTHIRAINDACPAGNNKISEKKIFPPKNSIKHLSSFFFLSC